jgi:hypothetical protein
MNYKEEAIAGKEFFDDCLTILTKKANDYASEKDCFSNFKIISQIAQIPIEQVFMVFLGVKVARLSELVGNGKTAQNESVIDSLKDLANYSCLLAIYKSQEVADV